MVDRMRRNIRDMKRKLSRMDLLYVRTVYIYIYISDRMIKDVWWLEITWQSINRISSNVSRITSETVAL